MTDTAADWIQTNIGRAEAAAARGQDPPLIQFDPLDMLGDVALTTVTEVFQPEIDFGDFDPPDWMVATGLVAAAGLLYDQYLIDTVDLNRRPTFDLPFLPIPGSGIQGRFGVTVPLGARDGEYYIDGPTFPYDTRIGDIGIRIAVHPPGSHFGFPDLLSGDRAMPWFMPDCRSRRFLLSMTLALQSRLPDRIVSLDFV